MLGRQMSTQRRPTGGSSRMNESSDTPDNPDKPQDYPGLRAELAELVNDFLPVADELWPRLQDHKYSAARVRDAGLESSGRRGATGRLPVSYSRKVFIPVTHLCRDTCHYCTFVTVPGKLRAQGAGMYLEPDEILDTARQGALL